MMKIATLIFVVLLLTGRSFAQQLSLDDIPLTWNDFKHVKDKKLPKYAALTYSSMQYQKSGQRGDSVYQFKTTVAFSPKKSMVRKSFLKRSNDAARMALLDHEKCHYIITLIQYKKACNAIKAMEDSHTYGNADSIFRACIIENKKRQLEYDRATGHGLKKPEQQKWETQLIAEMDRLYNNEKKIALSYETEFVLIQKRHRY